MERSMVVWYMVDMSVRRRRGRVVGLEHSSSKEGATLIG
jgi:hypothetical protein